MDRPTKANIHLLALIIEFRIQPIFCIIGKVSNHKAFPLGLNMAKILAVDDSKTVRNLMGNMLKREGHEVVAAVDGEDGIEKLRENPDIQILIADINMPKMNGFEMLQAMNAYRMLTDVKTIFVTTEPSPEFIDKIMKQGAFAWIMKPFNQAQLCEVINKALEPKPEN